MRTEGLRRALLPVSIILALLFSTTFIPTPTFAAQIIAYPGVGGIPNIYDPPQGQTFLLRHRMAWDDEANPGFYLIAIWWDYFADNAYHFTLDSVSTYFDNDGDNLPDPGVALIDNSVKAHDNGTRRSIAVSNAAGDWRLGIFNVDITLRASGPDGTPHVATDNHPIFYTIIQCFEAFPPAVAVPGPVTVRVVSLLPGQPTLFSPADGTRTNDTTPTFEWTNGSNADNHRLLVDNNPGFSSPEIDSTVLVPDNAFTPTTALPDKNYSWKVIARNAVGENHSDIWTFVIDTVPPATPSLISPPDGTTTDDNTPTFDWSDVAGAENYDLLLDDNPDFSSPEIQVTVSVSTYTPTVGLPDYNYSWKVRARDAAGNVGGWSSTWTLLIKTIVRGVEVSISPGSKSGAPGETLTYTVTVANTGNVEDTYDLVASDNAGWGPTVSPISLTIPAGGSDTATLGVTIPLDASGDQDTIEITATSRTDTMVWDTAVCTAQVMFIMGVDVSISPASKSGAPGETLTYEVTVKNTGSIDDTYTLSAVGAAGWSVSIEPTSLTLAAGATGVATLSVVVPPDASVGISMTTTVSARSEGYPAVIDTDTCRTIVVGAVPPEVWVDDDWAGSNPGDVVDGHIFGTDAFAMIQDGIDAVASPGTVHVAAGTYYETITLKDGAQVLGAGANVTTIDGEGGGSVVTAINVGPNTVLDGFTITNGSGTENYLFTGWVTGGGIFCRNSALMITNNVIVNNFAQGGSHGNVGGGIYCFRGSPAIVGNTVTNNYASHYGGGIFLEEGSPTVSNNVIISNSAEWDGGGININGGSGSITPVIQNNIISNNATLSPTGQGGGGILVNVTRSSFEIVNNTIYGNQAASSWSGGGGINVMNQSDLLMKNNILWANTAYNGSQIILSGTGSLSVTYSDIEGGYLGEGNISADPMFVNPANNDYRLQAGSPCIDAGTNERAPTEDIEGNPRPIDGNGDEIAVVDMGAYEYVPPPSPGIGWDASITATFSGGSDDATFSVRPDATSGFDIAYDLPEPPRPVAPPYLRTFFYYPEQTPNELHRSCLGPEILMEWPLRIEYAEGFNDITLTWSVEDVPADYPIYLYRGENLVADMRAEEDYTFQASAGSYDFRIVVWTVRPFTLELIQGWNMISFPVLPRNMSPDAIFGGYYVLYRWDAESKRYVLHADSGNYIEPDPDVEAGAGYWAYVLENENLDLLGVPVNQLNLSLRQGWNLIGSTYSVSSIADPIDDPDNTVVNWAFTWDASQRRYTMSQLLEPGKGYWIYALGDCSLVLSISKPVFKIAIVYDIGGRGDMSFNDMAYMGGKRAEQEFGVGLVEMHSITEADYLPNLRAAARDSDTVLVVGVGYLLTDALLEVAQEYPNKNFAGIDTFAYWAALDAGITPPPNMMDIVYEEHKGSALVGALGALLAIHYDKPYIGGVFGIEIPVLWKFEIAYKWGAEWAVRWYASNYPSDYAAEPSTSIVNTPIDERVLYTYTGTFSDITKGYEAASVMYDEDAVAVYNIAGPLGLGINSAVKEIAEAENLENGPPFWIGVDADQDWINPGFVIASMMKKADYGVYYATELVRKGLFRDAIAATGGWITLGIGTTVLGLPMEGISVSTLADLDEFIEMGIRAEELTGATVLPMEPEEIRSKVRAMRDALPDWIWDAVAELETKIRTGEPIADLDGDGELETVPAATTQDAVDSWRAIFG